MVVVIRDTEAAGFDLVVDRAECIVDSVASTDVVTVAIK